MLLTRARPNDVPVMNEREQGRIPTAPDGFAAVASPERSAMPVGSVASTDRSMRMVELFISVMAIVAALLVAAMR